MHAKISTLSPKPLKYSLPSDDAPVHKLKLEVSSSTSEVLATMPEAAQERSKEYAMTTNFFLRKEFSSLLNIHKGFQPTSNLQLPKFTSM